MASGRQQQRTASTMGLLLDSATRLFGSCGYANTSLEDIALDCGLTIGAIYHHFGNKKSLFSAVNEAAEQRIIAAGAATARDQHAAPVDLLHNQWRAFVSLCDEPGFRQIVLIDSPNILGRDRWTTSAVTAHVEASHTGADRRGELALRILRGAMAEAALALAEADNNATTREAVDALIEQLATVVANQL